MPKTYNNCDDTYSDMVSLGKQETSMTFIVKQERVVTIATTTFDPPVWMQYAFKGEKINAIKSLRNDFVRTDTDGHKLSFVMAKDIVDSVCAGLSTRNELV